MSFKVSSGPVTAKQAVEFADQLENTIGLIINGEIKSNKIPIEPIVKLIQYVRNNVECDRLDNL